MTPIADPSRRSRTPRSVPRTVCHLGRLTKPPTATSFCSDKCKRHPPELAAVHPRAFKEVMEDHKNSKREHHPRPSGVAICHAPNSVEGCHDDNYEQSKANGPQLQHRI